MGGEGLGKPPFCFGWRVRRRRNTWLGPAPVQRRAWGMRCRTLVLGRAVRLSSSDFSFSLSWAVMGLAFRIVGDGRGCSGLLKGDTSEFVSLLVPKGGFGSGKRSSVCEGK